MTSPPNGEGGIKDFVTTFVKPYYYNPKMRDDGGKGCRNCPNLRDVIYGRPFRISGYVGGPLQYFMCSLKIT